MEGSVNSAADAEDRARREVAKGVWAAVDTSPDLRGSKCPQNLRNDGYSTQQAADTKRIRESFLSLDLFSLTFKNILLTILFCLQCFDAVGWAAGRASGL